MPSLRKLLAHGSPFMWQMAPGLDNQEAISLGFAVEVIETAFSYFTLILEFGKWEHTEPQNGISVELIHTVSEAQADSDMHRLLCIIA